MKTSTTPANTTPAIQHFTFFDLETHWDEVLHNNYCFIEQTESWSRRIGIRRIHAAAAFDLALAEDGAITCERIASWTMPNDDGEKAWSRGCSRTCARGLMAPAWWVMVQSRWTCRY